MEKKTRICSVCGSSYTFCPRCNEDRDKPNWYFAFCSENCKNIYDTASKFEDGRISGEEAYKSLKELDLSRKEFFGYSYKESIKKINKFKKTQKKVKSVENENNIEPETHIEVIIEPEKIVLDKSETIEQNVE